MLILDLWGISFHAVVVFGVGKNLLSKSILGRCEIIYSKKIIKSESEFGIPCQIRLTKSMLRFHSNLKNI